LLNQGKVGYCSVDATAHYSEDWSQDMQNPHHAEQPKKAFYESPDKIGLFGIQNEGLKNNLITCLIRAKWLERIQTEPLV
jgi:hypothetical protein